MTLLSLVTEPKVKQVQSNKRPDLKLGVFWFLSDLVLVVLI